MSSPARGTISSSSACPPGGPTTRWSSRRATHGVGRIALSDDDAAARAAEAWTGGEVLGGPEGLVRLVAESDADLVLNAIVGSAGLGPTIVALAEGIDVALANKESLVVGGELVTALAEATGAQLIPIDSEHTALHHLLTGEPPGAVERLVITASGGPFRGRTDLEHVTVEEALKHPTWSMGGKITIDSATLMNKGLELMEAHHLFGTPYDRIDVVVHPQSIVHAMVSLCDGSTKAHLGYPDMRVAIAYALHHPDRADVPIPTLDLVGRSLTFEAPDDDAFPCLRLAREAALAGGTAPCVLNAANEVAVHAFLGERLPFLGIPAVIERTLERVPVAARARVRLALRGRHGGPRGGRRARRGPHRMSFFLAFLGFAVLIILHELGHFAAAKAVGMRVERFSLFFPPLLARKRHGETEYAIGAIPLGGYVKITGMNPAEEIAPEVAHRAYYKQAVWKRIVVIAAGPAVNIVLAFLLLWVIFMSTGTTEPPARVDAVERGLPAAGQLERGDVIVAVDGKRPAGEGLREQSEAIADRDLVAQVRRRADGGLPGGRAGAAHRAPRRARADARAARRCTTTRPSSAHAPGLRLRRDALPRRSAPGRGAGRRADVAGDLGHRLDDRPDLRRREAQGDLRRGRQLRGHPAVDRVRHHAGAVRAGAHLPVARRHQPVPVPAAGRRAHLLGAWRRRCAGARSRSA